MGAMLSLHAFFKAWRTTKKTDVYVTEGIEIVRLDSISHLENIPIAVGIPISLSVENGYV